MWEALCAPPTLPLRCGHFDRERDHETFFLIESSDQRAAEFPALDSSPLGRSLTLGLSGCVNPQIDPLRIKELSICSRRRTSCFPPCWQ